MSKLPYVSKVAYKNDKKVPVIWHEGMTVNLSRKSYHRAAYKDLAMNGSLIKTFSDEFQARSFRHGVMRVFNGCRLQTKMDKIHRGYRVVTKLARENE